PGNLENRKEIAIARQMPVTDCCNPAPAGSVSVRSIFAVGTGLVGNGNWTVSPLPASKRPQNINRLQQQLEPWSDICDSTSPISVDCCIQPFPYPCSLFPPKAMPSKASRRWRKLS